MISLKSDLEALYGHVYGHLSDRSRYYLDSFARGIPGVGSALVAQDNLRYMDDYLRNRGMSYSDIRYVSRTSGAQSLGSSVNYVSKNVEKLYR